MADDPGAPPPSRPSGGGFEPATIEQYRIESVVARGGVGTVCRATDTTLDRIVAIKVLDEPGGALALIEEARHVSRLSHPRIAQVYEAGVDSRTGLAFIAFEWVEGPTLRARLREGELPLLDLLRLGRDITGAVAHAHEGGIVHGDLKADNIVVAGEPGRAKLLDFGLSVADEEIAPGEIWGTPAYMAPELLRGEPRTPATDRFALGVLLFELATGTLPFGGEKGDETEVRALQRNPAPRARELRPDLPSELSDRIARLLSREPVGRDVDLLELERIFRLRRRAAEGRRFPLPGALLLGLLVLIAVSARDEVGVRVGGWLGIGSPGGGAEIAAGAPTIGAWTGPGGEESAAAGTVADLLRLLTAKADPGSALLAPGDGTPITGTVEIGGSAAGTGEWRASWRGPNGRAGSAFGAGALPLATSVATAILGESPGPIAGRPEEALLLFVEGVRSATGEARGEALALLSRARASAGAFPEATGWMAALRLCEGRVDEAAALLSPLSGTDSVPARLLDDVLSIPVRGRALRWGADHPVARRVDLLLAILDPRESDARLTERLGRSAEDPGPIEPWVARIRVELAWRRGSIPEMGGALDRLRLLEGPVRTTEAVRLEHARRLALGPRDEAIASFRDRIIEAEVDGPEALLRVPFLAQTGRLAAAAGAARRPAASTEDAVATAFALALGGEFEAALARAGEIVDRADPGRASRVEAALEVLRGSTEAALRALERAEQLEPGRPETVILRAAIERSLLEDLVLPEGEAWPVDSRAGRLADGFSLLAAARRSRLAGDPRTAADSLAGLRVVADDLRFHPWPELVLFGRLERVLALSEAGEETRAREEWGVFRRDWPRERAPDARVSRRASEVERRLAEAGGR